MKNIKYIFAVVLSATMLFANAQEAAKVKDYSAYLPKSGDLGITINAVPILTYVGQLANGATANSLKEFGGQPLHNKTVRDLGMLDDDLLSISMKYLVTDKFATRINLGFNYMYFNERAYSINDAALAIDPFSQEKVIDSRKSNHANISLFLGQICFHNSRHFLQSGKLCRIHSVVPGKHFISAINLLHNYRI